MNADEAAEGLPLVAFTKHIHPEDLPDFEEKIACVRQRGGLFVIEYRTCPTPRDIRWVLARGRFEWDSHAGGIIGRGIVIDITDSKSDGQVEDRAFFVKPEDTGPSLERLAGFAIEVHNEIEELGEAKGSILRQAIDTLLWAIGRKLATQQQTDTKRWKNLIN
ncbi:PAS domain-containing protein [Methylobacterium sp. J-076]|nr:PAS domain-containing protein [Methylobacterium sp. J-076]